MEVSQSKTPSTRSDTESKVKNTLPISHRRKEPKLIPLIRRDRDKHKAMGESPWTTQNLSEGFLNSVLLCLWEPSPGAAMPGFCPSAAAVPGVSNGQDPASAEPQTQAPPYSKGAPAPGHCTKMGNMGPTIGSASTRWKRCQVSLQRDTGYSRQPQPQGQKWG